MAIVAINTADTIQFVNFTAANGAIRPTLIVQSGDWENGSAVEAGVIFDVEGDQAPILNSNDVRKLSKWLQRAADALDGVKKSDKKHKHRHNNGDNEDDEFDQY